MLHNARRISNIYLQHIGKFNYPEITRLPFIDTFNRCDGYLRNGWLYTPDVFKITENEVYCDPPFLSTIDINGDMELDSGWINYGTPTLNAQSNEQVYSGSYSRKFGATEAGAGIKTSNFSTTSWTPYCSKAYCYSPVTPATFHAGISFQTASIPRNFIQDQWNYFGSGGWGTVSSSSYALAYAKNAGNFYVDKMEIGRLGHNDIIAVRKFDTSSIDISISINCLHDNRLGIMLCVDNPDNPQNYLLAQTSGVGSVARLYKVLNGSGTAIVANNVTYVQDSIIRCVKNGNKVTLYFNGVVQGTTQTVTDSSIVNNIYHGISIIGLGSRISSFVATGV